MTYHVARNNQQLGAFSKEDTLARYNRGEILPTDLVWTEGMVAWQSASQVLGAPIAPATPPPIMPMPIAAGATVPAPTQNACSQRPPNSLTLAIVATVLSVLSCNPFALIPGIIAIVMAAQVDGKFNASDIIGAHSSAKAAKILGWVSIAIFAVALPLFMMGFISGFMGAMHQHGY